MAVVLRRMRIATDRRTGESRTEELPEIAAHSFALPESFKEQDEGVFTQESHYPLTVVTHIWQAA